MNFDETGCLIREKYEAGHPANLGDSCGETCRSKILGDTRGDFMRFVTPNGYLRHPDSIWREDDFSNDMLLPLLMAADLVYVGTQSNRWRIRGTKTVVSAGVWAMSRKYYRLLNMVNIVQGWLFTIKWRIADGGKVEPIEGQVQDWLNYICVYVFLKRMGKWATLNQSRDRCMRAIQTYYLEGPDWEPNSEWIVELYEKALKYESASLS